MRTAFNFLVAAGFTAALAACGSKGGGGPLAVQCANPILMNDPSMRRLMRMSEMPTGQFQLTSVQVYLVDPSSNSFSASASSVDNFSSASVDCSGVNPSARPLLADFVVGTSMDFANDVHGEDSIMLTFEFNNGQIATATSRLVQTFDSQIAYPSPAEIEKGRIRLGADQYKRVEIYLPTFSQIETHVEIEGAADSIGRRTLEFIRAIYKKTKR